MADLSLSSFFTNTEPSESIKEAKVELYLNDIFEEEMQWESNKKSVFISTVRPKTGDIVKIIAYTEYGSVWAVDTVPEKVKIENIAFSCRRFIDDNSTAIDGQGNITKVEKIEIKYQITFHDIPAKFN